MMPRPRPARLPGRKDRPARATDTDLAAASMGQMHRDHARVRNATRFARRLRFGVARTGANMQSKGVIAFDDSTQAFRRGPRHGVRIAFEIFVDGIEVRSTEGPRFWDGCDSSRPSPVQSNWQEGEIRFETAIFERSGVGRTSRGRQAQSLCGSCQLDPGVHRMRRRAAPETARSHRRRDAVGADAALGGWTVVLAQPRRRFPADAGTHTPWR